MGMDGWVAHSVAAQEMEPDALSVVPEGVTASPYEAPPAARDKRPAGPDPDEAIPTGQDWRWQTNAKKPRGAAPQTIEVRAQLKGGAEDGNKRAAQHACTCSHYAAEEKHAGCACGLHTAMRFLGWRIDGHTAMHGRGHHVRKASRCSLCRTIR